MTNGSLARATLIAFALSLTPSLAVAQAPGAEATKTGSAAAASQPAAEVAKPIEDKPLPPGFERVAGAPAEEQLDPNPLVVAAYAMFFVVMFGYLIHVARSQAAIAREMAELAERIKRAEKSS
ncbi:hypothetical protein L6R52_26835 [Myxococcota bacterium]|nr:hypothetical protein [Myxococcota bacterium]